MTNTKNNRQKGIICKHCNGRGILYNDKAIPEQCPECGGRGWISKYRRGLI